MSNTLVRYAVAAAIAAAAATGASAQQAILADYAHNQQAGLNVNVYISGSTAVDNTLASELNTPSLNICSGTVTEYLDTSHVLNSSGNAIGGAIEYMYYCQAGTSSGVSTNDFIAVFKESTAGSINGAQPLIAVAKGGPSALTFMNPEGPDVGTTNCFPAGSPVGSGGTSGGSSCTAADFQQNVVPTGGVADVEANLLLTIPGGGQLAPADISADLTGAPGLDVVWGVALTKKLFYALQTAEGLENGSVIAACNSTTTPTSVDSPQCAPSLSKTQVASLLVGANNNNGDLLSWSQIGLNNTSDNNVYICRRDIGSGTEASFEAYFLGARCSSSSEAMSAQDGQFVVESASTGNVLTCMEAFNQGGIEITPYNADFNTSFPAFTPAGNQWAIGVVSTELTSTQLAGKGDPIRLVAVDGVLPTIANVVNGYYPYFSTDSWYHIPSGKTGTSVGTTAFSVFSAIQGDIGHPTPTHNADANYSGRPWGSGGDLSPASLFATAANAGYTSFPVSTSAVEANPINVFTKGSSGSINNCDTPVLYGNINSGLTQQTSPEGNLHGSGAVNN